MEEGLHRYFNYELGYKDLTTKQQKFRLYLKLPILQDIGITRSGESDFLQLKIEVNSTKQAEGTYSTEMHPFFGCTRTFFIRRYDLETLMA